MVVGQDDRRSFSETASVCQEPSFRSFPFFANLGRARRRAGPPLQQGPRRRRRELAMNGERAFPGLGLWHLRTSDGCGLAFRSARCLHPSLRARCGELIYARRMMQDAMRRWRHLGLGLAAAKERLALTVRNIIRRTFLHFIVGVTPTRSCATCFGRRRGPIWFGSNSV